jgi:hypothetical protein
MNYNFITTRLATGSLIQSEQDIQTLIKDGITHIIDCTDTHNDLSYLTKYPQIIYLYNGVADDGKPKPISWFELSLKFALPAIALPHNKVYAHCDAGINRGPSTIYAIMKAQGYNRFLIEALIKTGRPETIVGLRYINDADTAIKALGYD